MPVPDNGTRLKTYIQSRSPDELGVSLVGHSMGGLLARDYLRQASETNNAARILTVGTPHLGLVDSYPVWSAGKILEGDLVWKFYLKILEKRCTRKSNWNDRQAVEEYFPSVRDTLPVFTYLYDKDTGTEKQFTDMHAKNLYLENPAIFDFRGSRVGTLTGTNFDTTKNYLFTNAKKHDDLWGNWADGFPADRITSTQGDGTVLIESAQLPNAENLPAIKARHNDLLTQGKSEILEFLGYQDHTGQPEASDSEATDAESEVFIAGYPVSFWILTPDMRIVRDTAGLVELPNPKPGKYRVLMVPSAQDADISVARILPNGKILWKDLTLKENFPKIGTLFVGSDEQPEDSLFTM